MKTALCLSGLVRNYEDCLDSHIKFFLQEMNADVFIHTWSKIGSNKVPHWYTDRYSLEEHKRSILTQKELDRDRLLQNYNPTNYSIEFPDIDFFIKKFYREENIKFVNNVMMHYGISKANDLKKQYEAEYNVSYDLVIRCRFDLYFENIIFDEQTLSGIESGTIYLAPNQNMDNKFTKEMLELCDKEGMSYMPNDQFAYSNTEGMDYYSSVYSIFDSNYDLYHKHPEGILSQHLWKKNKSKYKDIRVNDSIKMRIQSRYWR